MPVTIEHFQYGEKGCDIDEIYYSITLKEYKSPTISVVDSSSFAKRPPVQRPTPPPVFRTHTVVRGDCLWNISKTYLGDARRYMEIARLNNIPNPRLIYPGQVFKLPW